MPRPAAPADRAALVALALAEDAAWSGASPVSDDEAGELVDAYAPGVVVERDGRIAGYAAIDEGGRAMVLLDPEPEPGPALELLVTWLGERGVHEVVAYARDAPRIAWLEAHGFVHRLSAFDLTRGVEPPPAPAVWPRDVVVAPFRAGEEDEAVHALVYVDAGWGDVPGHTVKSLDTWRSLLGPEYRGWVARRDGRPVGWVAARVFGDGRGWIEQLAVARAARGHGLGRALLLHALAALRSDGATALALGVQAANEHALGLYRDVGFVVEREWRSFARPPA